MPAIREGDRGPVLGRAAFVIRAGFHAKAQRMAQRPIKTSKPLLTMHGWEAKHYVVAAVIILVVMGMFVYSWA